MGVLRILMVKSLETGWVYLRSKSKKRREGSSGWAWGQPVFRYPVQKEQPRKEIELWTAKRRALNDSVPEPSWSWGSLCSGKHTRKMLAYATVSWKAGYKMICKLWLQPCTTMHRECLVHMLSKHLLNELMKKINNLRNNNHNKGINKIDSSC